MKTIYRLFVYLIFTSVSSFILLNASCKKEEECEHPNLTEANLAGKVNLFDDLEGALSDSGMTVYILDSNPLVSDVTDENGNYSLDNLIFGSYTLVYSKQGYGTFLQSVLHADDCQLTNTMPEYYLGERSTTTITSFTTTTIPSGVKLNIGIFPEGSSEEARYVRVFYSNQSDVSNSSYDFQSGLIEMTEANYTITLNIGDIHGMGFQTGETVYCKVYGDSFHSNEYFDFDIEGLYYPNTNIVTQPNVEFIAP